MAVSTLVNPIWRMCRLVSAALIAGVQRDKSLKDILNWLEACPAPRQGKIVLASLGLLAGGAFIAAQIGTIAMLLYFMAIILIVR